MARGTKQPLVWSQPSWWIVLTGAVLTAFFLIAITREIIRTATVRRQVERLRSELANETRRQAELEDLIGYLRSPTFQEREARLKLGLKKSGERVIVIPAATNTATNSTNGGDGLGQTGLTSPAQRWWQYFFASPS